MTYTVEVRNRFKGLDLIECLMNYGWRIVTLYRKQELRQPPRKRNEKAKWLSEEALQIAEKRREVKGKGGKQRYIHLNAEFGKIARRDKNAFLSSHSKYPLPTTQEKTLHMDISRWSILTLD